MPKDIDARVVNNPAQSNADKIENFNLYLGSARAAGAVFDRTVNKDSLREPNPTMALQCMWQNIKCGIAQSFVREPSIRAALAKEGGLKVEVVRDEWGAHKICFAWINWKAKQGGYAGGRSIETFSDMSDMRALVHIANAIWGTGTTTQQHDPAQFLQLLREKGISDVACPDALTAGHGRSLYSVVGALFKASLNC